MRVDLFDYELPAELIAQEPAARRDGSRMLVLSRHGDEEPLEHHFYDLPKLLRRGDLLVVNDALVYPARLFASRATGGLVEILLLRPSADLRSSPDSEAGGHAREAVWEALVRPARRIRRGERLTIAAPEATGSTPSLEVIGESESGRKLIALPADAAAFLDSWGHMPLPPYIHRRRDDERASLDRARYQTVYARAPGAVAAPTAGLHFTPELFAALERSGVARTALTLNVGPGTFQPLRVAEIDQHSMDRESYVLPQACVEAIVAARRRGGRVIGVGTTVVRTLEHAARRHGALERAAGAGKADIFIYPGFEFRVVDAMITNFHLPRSTPILMVAALVGRERLLRAYELAVARRMRFYSYGDAMLIR